MKLDSAIRLAIENVKRDGLTDIFPKPFELDLLNNEKLCNAIIAQVKTRLEHNNLAKLKIYPLGYVLFPKKELFDFRKAALIHPIDTIIYSSLIFQYADELEKHRIKKSKKIVFSYRFAPKKGKIFDDKYNFTSFQAEVSQQKKKKTNKILIKCDISNFYDRLNLHRLESTLLSLGNINEKLIKLTNNLLLYWANRDSYGLPVGGNASRILAEAALISIDDYLISHKIKFCRFVDDYRFFAPDIETAHEWLAIFVERLHMDGLTINPLKTVIEDISNDLVNEPKKFNTSGKNNKLISGYSGTIPTKFRELSEKEILQLKSISIDNLINSLNKTLVLNPSDVKQFIRLIIAQNNFSNIKFLLNLLDKFPQFTPLVTDILIKKSENISTQDKELIKEFFSKKLEKNSSQIEYLQISIIKILGYESYKNIPVLMDFFRNLKRNSGAFIGRAVLDALYKNINRTEALEIRQYFNRADNWEKRAIIRIVNDVFHTDELRPWLKNIKIHLEDDLFAIEIFDPKK